MPARQQSPLFEGLLRKLVLGVMPRPGREFDVAKLLQLTADGGLIERVRKLVMEPLRQIEKTPAHHPVDRRNRAALDNIDQRPTLRIVQPRTGERAPCRPEVHRGRGH